MTELKERIVLIQHAGNTSSESTGAIYSFWLEAGSRLFLHLAVSINDVYFPTSLPIKNQLVSPPVHLPVP